ncbi:SH3 domain-containing protein [Aliiroseovarius crassostreae]|uniref:SH3 domain-containing protein n=1 Tax=Aliiroseovarius crassostreae TaxID=154981 RepID=UPI0022084D24|nr:SH3 domain-containing protein [Aliiroseovarius crassostreae]UWP98420.1 SH3 domain-containing protein [Aliiroseovarius crassostreae]
MKLKWIILLMIGWGPLPATANPLPALFDVVDVTSDDVLNVRALPDTGSEIIGTLAPDQTGIEVTTVSEDLKWGQVNAREQAGWVSLRYLMRQPGQDWGQMPWPLSCYGTEPFWDLFTDGENELVLEHMDAEKTRFLITMTTGVVGRADRFWIRGENEAGEALLTLRREECHDGMSDRAYGLGLDSLIDHENGPYALSGCCSILPR